MSELDEVDWATVRREHKEVSREKRSANRENSARILTEHGVLFEVKNFGSHLIVGQPALVDFWPGTGKWKFRTTQQEGRGVYALLRRLGIKCN